MAGDRPWLISNAGFASPASTGAPLLCPLRSETGQRLLDFEVVGDPIQYQTGIAIGTSHCESRLGPPDEDQFEC